jgi:hypothetical protein
MQNLQNADRKIDRSSFNARARLCKVSHNVQGLAMWGNFMFHCSTLVLVK